MEHRCTARHRSELEIQIYKHAAPVATGYVKNGNRWGVFVETVFNDVECEHQIELQIISTCVSSKKLEGVRIPGIVVHQGAKGFGVELDIDSQEHAELFVEILHEMQIEYAPFASVANVTARNHDELPARISWHRKVYIFF
ncbi:MAG: hypothetical protein EOO68_37345 [Moraxellaceae bacterium]|nr:MAG: hypothetical protein EOO68_37345 [Moraxellaceae bacterium]